MSGEAADDCCYVAADADWESGHGFDDCIVEGDVIVVAEVADMIGHPVRDYV